MKGIERERRGEGKKMGRCRSGQRRKRGGGRWPQHQHLSEEKNERSEGMGEWHIKCWVQLV